MSVETVLPQKSPEETQVAVFDFTSQLGQTQQVLISGSVTATVWAGTDPNPGNVVSGGVSNNTTQVFCTLVGGLAGVIYKLRIVGTTTLSAQSLVQYAYLAVVEDPL